MVIMQQG